MASSTLELSLRLRLLPYSGYRYWALTGLISSPGLTLTR
jgi:hypothetical protein